MVHLSIFSPQKIDSDSKYDDIPPQINFEYGYPDSNALLQFPLKLGVLQAAHHRTKYDVINDFKLFPTVYYRIYCRKFLMLSDQTSRYNIKCIRISVYVFRVIKTDNPLMS